MFITQSKTNWKYVSVVAIVAVVAGGLILYYWQNIQKEIISISQQIIQIQRNKTDKIVDNSVSSTPGWQAYQNAESGFEIKYPTDKLFESSFSCRHSPSGQTDQKATQFSNSEMFIYLCKFTGDYINLANSFGTSTPVMIDNHNGLTMRTEINFGGRTFYFIEIKKGQTLMIDTFWAYDENKSFKDKEQLFDQMLSTFKFVE